MLNRLTIVGVALSLLVARGISLGQICQTTHQTDLYCLIPSAFRTTATPFEALYAPFGTELSQLPIAKPAGLVLKFENGVLTPTNESLGPVFSGRAETIGKSRVFLGGTFQHFGFSSIDGNKLGSLPIVLSFTPQGQPAVYTVTTNRFDIKASQYTLLAAYGITDKIDISAALPFERIAMSVAVAGTEFVQDSSSFQNFSEYVPGSSSGVGDLLLGAKATFFERAKFSLAAGFDLRLPTGDELNFLGSGTIGLKPYLVVSRHSRVSPHLNLGVQKNGKSILNPDPQGNKLQLPADFLYVVGADASVSKHVTVVADLLGHRFFNAPRLSAVAPFGTPINNPNLLAAPQTVTPYTSSYTTNDLSLGAKGQIRSHFVFTGNLLIKLGNGGLRSRLAPLGGLSYSF